MVSTARTPPAPRVPLTKAWTPTQGEIVWLEFDPQSGQEQAGRRPAVVLSKTAYNQRIGRAFVCPITSKIKGYPFEVLIEAGRIQGAALSDHAKNIDWRARSASPSGEHVSEAAFEQIWALINSLH